MDAAATTPVPEKSESFLQVLKRPSVRLLSLSRLSSKLAQSTMSYGAMVYLAIQGASQMQISMVSASTYVASLLFGFQGGSLADSLSKRMAVVVGYISLAFATLFIPAVFGTEVPELMAIMFLSSALMQIISPSLKSAVALVSTPEAMAGVGATVSIVGSIGSAVGSSIVAPILINIWGINAVLVTSALVYLVGSIWTYKLPVEENGMQLGEAIKKVEWKPKALSLRFAAEWIVSHRAVAAIILVGAIAVSLFEAFNTLIPVYVRDVLNANPANAVYIFAPAALGFLAGTVITPPMIGRIGARKLAVISVAIMSFSMMLFGLIDWVAPILAPISPLRLLGWLFDVEISDKVLAASLIAIPCNFGSTAAGASVQTQINLRVPVINQGATFGLQEIQENALTLVLLLVLGMVSSIVGPEIVFVVAPVAALIVVLLLIRYSYRKAGPGTLSRGAAFSELIGDDDFKPGQVPAPDPEPPAPAPPA